MDSSSWRSADVEIEVKGQNIPSYSSSFNYTPHSSKQNLPICFSPYFSFSTFFFI